jgi:hypothetical protein
MTNTDIATQWIDTLTARGVSLRTKGKRLEWQPGSAYKDMSDDEHRTYRHHKADIIAVINERYNGMARGDIPTVEPAPTATPPPAPVHCRWCNSAPCIGEQHPAFLDLHPRHQPKPTYDLAALYRSGSGLLKADLAVEAAPPDDPDAVMLRQIGKPLPAWWWWI